MKTGKKVGVDADRDEVDGPAEKDLDLPSPKRLRAGRAEPSIGAGTPGLSGILISCYILVVTPRLPILGEQDTFRSSAL